MPHDPPATAGGTDCITHDKCDFGNGGTLRSSLTQLAPDEVSTACGSGWVLDSLLSNRVIGFNYHDEVARETHPLDKFNQGANTLGYNETELNLYSYQIYMEPQCA